MAATAKFVPNWFSRCKYQTSGRCMSIQPAHAAIADQRKNAATHIEALPTRQSACQVAKMTFMM
ncbi:hypothetical protein CA603_00505 [Paraburkholderia hospita]|nr:hypothetical protein CA603_00505 [Paraburkholderia hospita]